MITIADLASSVPGLDEQDEELQRFLACQYNHATQMRDLGPTGEVQGVYPTSTRFDGDRT